MNNWNQLKPQSRIWIYGANRPFHEHEAVNIETYLNKFCATWAAHGAKLLCGFKLVYNQFIIIAVDEESAAASGCSIDKSIEIIEQIDSKLNLDLFNRFRSYEVVSESPLSIIPLTVEEVKSKIEKGELNQFSKMINMQGFYLRDITPDITQPLSNTWLQKYLPKTMNQ